jgi:hypothetical protein
MRSVAYAAELCGGYAALAQRLFARADDVIGRSSGRAFPDNTNFLIILHIILLETKQLSRAVEALELAEVAVRKAQRSSRLGSAN